MFGIEALSPVRVAEVIVILAIVLLVLYVLYRLNLFKRE